MPEHDWAFYLTEINDNAASVYLDLGLIDAAPDPTNPMLVCCSVTMHSPREDGLSSQEEFDKLCAIEDSLHAAVKGLVVVPGRITSADSRDFFYYCSDAAAVEGKLRKAMEQSHPDYSFEIDVNADEEWDVYCQILYPSDEEMQLIQNERVVASLAEKGDQHHVSRPIAHWAYFGDAADRDAFVEAVTAEDFAVKTLLPPEDGRLGVVIERGNAIVQIDEAVLTLFRLAGQHNGDYDGWESVVILTDALPS